MIKTKAEANRLNDPYSGKYYVFYQKYAEHIFARYHSGVKLGREQAWEFYTAFTLHFFALCRIAPESLRFKN